MWEPSSTGDHHADDPRWFVVDDFDEQSFPEFSQFFFLGQVMWPAYSADFTLPCFKQTEDSKHSKSLHTAGVGRLAEHHGGLWPLMFLGGDIWWYLGMVLTRQNRDRLKADRIQKQIECCMESDRTMVYDGHTMTPSPWRNWLLNWRTWALLGPSTSCTSL